MCIGWASKSRKQIIESDEESLQDESVTRCICGEQRNILLHFFFTLYEYGIFFLFYLNLDSNGLMVQCDQCEVWQHCECMGLEEADIPDQYFCEQCRPTDQFERYKLQ